MQPQNVIGVYINNLFLYSYYKHQNYSHIYHNIVDISRIVKLEKLQIMEPCYEMLHLYIPIQVLKSIII